MMDRLEFKCEIVYFVCILETGGEYPWDAAKGSVTWRE